VLDQRNKQRDGSPAMTLPFGASAADGCIDRHLRDVGLPSRTSIALIRASPAAAKKAPFDAIESETLMKPGDPA
jgi:hypothetical protein